MNRVRTILALAILSLVSFATHAQDLPAPATSAPTPSASRLTPSPDAALSDSAQPKAVIDLPQLSPEEILKQAEYWMDRGLELAGQSEADSAAAFAQAATRYDTLVNEYGARNAEILRAMGVAKLHAGDVPGSIVALRAALELDPTDSRTRESLAAARADVEAAPEVSLATRTRRWLGLWRGYVPRAALLGSGLGLLALGWFIGAANTLWGKPRRLWIGASFIIGLLPLTLLGYDLWRGETTTHVVLAREATGRGGPSAEVYEPSYEAPLPAGLEAVSLAERGEWTRLRLASGDETWVRSDALIGVERLLQR